ARIVRCFSRACANAHEHRMDDFIGRAATNPHPATPKGAAGHAQACWHHNVRDRLGEIRVPTLITCGTLDRATLPSHSRYLHDHIPNSELIFIDEGGHFTPFQSPGEFVSISLGFLVKHRSTTSDAKAT